MPLIGLDDPLLSGSGGKTFKFERPGTVISGTIKDARKSQQTEFGTNKPKVYEDSGNPMMQIVVTLQTTLREPGDPKDDGSRNVYIKSGQPTQALSQTLRDVGAAGLDIGGELTMQYIGDGVATRGNPPKHYAFAYQPPAAVPMEAIAPAQPNYGYLPPSTTPPYVAPVPQQPVFQQPAPVLPVAQAQIPAVQQLITQPTAPVAAAPAAAPVAGGMTVEQRAIWEQLTPEQRAQLGLPPA